MPNMPPKKGLAYCMGLTSGWGTAEKVVNWGARSPPVKRMKAPLLPIWQRKHG